MTLDELIKSTLQYFADNTKLTEVQLSKLLEKILGEVGDKHG